MVARANDNEYGLASGVYGTNIDTINTLTRALKAGTVWVSGGWGQGGRAGGRPLLLPAGGQGPLAPGLRYVGVGVGVGVGVAEWDPLGLPGA